MKATMLGDKIGVLDFMPCDIGAHVLRPQERKTLLERMQGMEIHFDDQKHARPEDAILETLRDIVAEIIAERSGAVGEA